MPTRTTRTIRTPKTSNTLARCIEPVGEREFLDGLFEREPLVVPRDEPGRFDDLLSLVEVQRMVSSGALRYPGFRLVKAGERLQPRDYTSDIPWRPTAFTGAADVERVLREFDGGATIVLQALHHTHAPLAAFCRGLEIELGQPAQANAYFTPRGSQGLPVHHDTHDVFCLQVAGQKRWLVYRPALELPLRDQRYRPELGEPGEPVLDVVLQAGDTLYMPRGWLHEALTSETDSLHITIGIKLYTWLDALRAALDECGDELELRRSVPPDGTMDADLLELLRARLEPEAVKRRQQRKLLRTRRPILDDGLSELAGVDSVSEDTLLERRPTVLAELEKGTLVFEGKAVRVPPQGWEELEAIVSAEEPFRAGDLPGALDGAGRLVLVRRLIREGFLRRSATDG